MEIMNVLKKSLILAGCVAALGLGASALMAQGPGGPGGPGGGGGCGGGGGGGVGGGRGGFGNPQQMLDDYRQALGVTDEAEWNAISAKITAVSDAQQALTGGGRGRGGRGGRGGAGGGGGGFTPPAPTDAEAALQKAIDAKAPAAELKTKIGAVLAERAAKTAAAQAAYKKAQDDLRSVLSARQEAIATLSVPRTAGGGGGGGDFTPPPYQPLLTN